METSHGVPAETMWDHCEQKMDTWVLGRMIVCRRVG